MLDFCTTIRNKFTYFQVNLEAIEWVLLFEYLGRMILDKDCDQVAIENQLQRAMAKWNRFFNS